MPAPFVTTLLLSAIAIAAAGATLLLVGALVVLAVLLQGVVTAAEAVSATPADDLEPL